MPPRIEPTLTKAARILASRFERKTDACKKLGISTPYMSKILGGRAIPSPQLRKAIEAQYHVPVDAWEIRA